MTVYHQSPHEITVELQKQLLVLEPDPVFPGLIRGGRGTVYLNRLDGDFFSTNLMLKTRIGVFTTLLGTLVEFNILTRHVDEALSMYSLTAALSITPLIMMKLGGVKSPCKKTCWEIVYIFVGFIVFIWIILSVLLQIAKSKIGVDSLVIDRIPQIVNMANNATNAVAAEFTLDTQKSQNMWVTPQLQKIGQTVPTFAELWKSNGYLPNSTKLKQALTNANANEQSTGNSKQMTDEWLGQLLCLSFASNWAELCDESYCEKFPQMKEALFTPPGASGERVVYFDMRSDSNDTLQHHGGTSEFWDITHQVIRLNQAYVPCVAFVKVGNTPESCRLVGVLQNETFITPNLTTNAQWMLCKANLTCQIFMLVEVFHMAIHKLSAMQALAQQSSVPVDDPLYRVLEPFGIVAASALEELETLLVAHEPNALRVFGFFVSDINGLKRVMSRTVKFFMNHKLSSPCSQHFRWWGSYARQREQVFVQTTKELLKSVTEHPFGISFLDEWCKKWTLLINGSNEQNETNAERDHRILYALYAISVQHADVTFVGGRIQVSPLQSLACGMLQQGISHDVAKWSKKTWQCALPKFGSDDFTLWWVNNMSIGYGTSQSSGPYLMDPAIYASTTPQSLLDIAEMGYDKLLHLGKQTQKNLTSCSFQPTWFYPPEASAKNFSTLTSGTYI